VTHHIEVQKLPKSTAAGALSRTPLLCFQRSPDPCRIKHELLLRLDFTDYEAKEAEASRAVLGLQLTSESTVQYYSLQTTDT